MDLSHQVNVKQGPFENEGQFRLEQQRFLNLFTQAPVSMCILKGEDHVFDKTNALFDRLVGRKDLIGRSAREAFPELEGQGWFELMDEVYRTGKTVSLDQKFLRFRIPGRDELKEVYLNFMHQPFRNQHGSVEGLVYFGVDITEQVLAWKKIEESERRYRQIVETAQEGMWLLDKDHHTLFVNKKMGEILGYETREMAGRNILEFTSEADRESVSEILRPCANEYARSFEMRFVSKEGESVWGHLNTTRITSPEGVYDGLLAMVTDVTERKVADEEIKKLSLIARSTTNAIIITNPEGRIDWVNEAFTRITGFPFQEAIGNTTSFLYGPNTDRNTRMMIRDCVDARQPFVCEIIKYKKQGTPFWVEIQGRPVFGDGGKLSYYFNMETDITERKQAYEQLLKTENQVRMFARQLNNMLEDERSRLAREIHDEFGQHLMGLKMSLSYLEKLNGLPLEAGGVIRELLSGVESTFQSLRDISTELRPGILDTLGLVPSIQWLAAGFEKKSGIRCSVNMKLRRQIFDRDLSITYFRICQEALTNILKHAEAMEVRIQLLQESNMLHMTIADDGKGMPSEKFDNPFSLGLLGMKERARLIGGDVHIVSTPGEGTQIKLSGKIDAA